MTGKPRTRPVVIFGSFITNDWSLLRQREHHVVEHLAKTRPVYYVERHGVGPMSLVDLARAIHKRLRQSPDSPAASLPQNVTFLRAPVIPLHGISIVDATNAIIVRWSLRHRVSVPLCQCLCWITYPSPCVLAVVRQQPFAAVVYDAVQRFSEVEDVFGPSAGRIDSALAELADQCFCDSLAVEADRRRAGVYCHRMPQGASKAYFSRPPMPSRRADAVRGLRESGPVLGYVGALSSVLDWPLVMETARRMPGWHLVFVGPAIDAVPRFLPANIHLAGWAPNNEVPSIMQSFDIGMIPYLRNRRTDAVMPTKLPEYLASGTRVLSTDVPDVVHFGRVLGRDMVAIARSPDEWISSMNRLLERGRLDASDVDLVSEHFSWERLLEDLDRVLSKSRKPPEVWSQ